MTVFTCTLTPEQRTVLEEYLRDRGFEFGSLAYGHWKAVGDKLNVAAYTSGKVVVQGRNTGEFVEFYLEPQILGVSATTAGLPEPAETFDDHGGIDESGKGDFFGPLAIAGVAIDADTGPRLRELGCRDSKTITGDRRIFALADGIRKIVPDRWTVVLLMPETYNRLYAQIGNLNRLLAWGHARAIENLLEKNPDCPRFLSDKFADESLIRRALMTRGRQARLDQQTKAESDVAVAAASILAREAFVRGMAKLAPGLDGRIPPRGAGPAVRAFAAELCAAHGPDALSAVTKNHFKTYSEIIQN